MIVVTPHLGDAVLGCTDLLAGHAGAVVVSVFAGIPSNAYVVPEWDAACGFSSCAATGRTPCVARRAAVGFRESLPQARAADCYESLARGFATAGRELRSWLAAPERYWRLSP